MRPASYEADLHIRKRRAGQNAEMRFFRKVCHYKALPIAVKLVQGTAAFKAQPRAALGRLDEQVHLGVMAQRLEMPDSVHRLRYGLLICNAARCYAHVKVKPLADKLGEHLGLHLAHYFHAYLAQALAPLDLQLRILVLELLELPVGNKRVCTLGQTDAVGHDRFGLRLHAVALKAETLTGICIVKPLHGDDAAGARLLHGFVICAGIYAQLRDRLAVYAVAIMQRAAGYFHAAEASVARIAHYLIHSCAELLGILRADGVFFYKLNKLLHALKLKPRAVQHREELSFKYEPRNIAVSDILPGRKLFKKLLIAHGNALARFLRVIRKVKAAL